MPKALGKAFRGRLLALISTLGAISSHEKGLREAGLGAIREATRRSHHSVMVPMSVLVPMASSGLPLTWNSPLA